MSTAGSDEFAVDLRQSGFNGKVAEKLSYAVDGFSWLLILRDW